MTKGTKNYPLEEIEKRTERLEGARKIRKDESEKNDEKLLSYIYSYPGKTLSEIESNFSNDPEWNKTFVRSYLINALKRLEIKHLVYFHTEESQGKILKRYYYKHKTQPAKIDISLDEIKGIVNIDINNWIEKLEIFAIEFDKIALTTSDNLEIKNKSQFSVKPQIQFYDNRVIVDLPERIIDFYKLLPDKFYFNWEIKANVIILQIEKIIETRIEPSRKIKKIIILEDDDDFREILTERLEEDDYKVESCKSDTELLTKIKKNKNGFDYFVADDTIGGSKLARAMYFELKKNFPNIKAGLISGASRDEREEQGFLDVGFTCIIQKGKDRKNQKGLSEIGEDLIQHLESLNERE